MAGQNRRTEELTLSKASAPLIPQLNKFLEQHRERSGSPAFGPIFANGAGKPVDLDSLYHRQMETALKKAGIEWEGWNGFRRGLATNLERIGLREAIAAMILRHSNDRVTRKHYIKPPSIEPVYAMQRLSDTLTTMQKPQLLPSRWETGRSRGGIAMGAMRHNRT
jgi:integrase